MADFLAALLDWVANFISKLIAALKGISTAVDEISSQYAVENPEEEEA